MEVRSGGHGEETEVVMTATADGEEGKEDGDVKTNGAETTVGKNGTKDGVAKNLGAERAASGA